MQENTMARVSMISGIVLIVLFFVGTCLGFIPFIGMVTIFCLPLNWLLAIVSVITGFMGLKQANMGAGGKGEAIAGLCMGGGFLAFNLLLLVIVGIVMLMGGGAAIMSALSQGM